MYPVSSKDVVPLSTSVTWNERVLDAGVEYAVTSRLYIVAHDT